jgi:hypothetical protein
MDEMPNWIRSERQRQIRNAMVRERGRDFFAQMLSRLEVNIENLANIGAHGLTSLISKPGEDQLRCRVDVGIKRGRPSITYTDVFYATGSAVVSSRTREGLASEFQLCNLKNGGIGVNGDGEFSQMNAVEFADWIVESAVERLRWEY